MQFAVTIQKRRDLVQRSEENRSLGRARRRWKDNIKVNLKEMGYDVGNSPGELSEELVT